MYICTVVAEMMHRLLLFWQEKRERCPLYLHLIKGIITAREQHFSISFVHDAFSKICT